MTVTIPEHRGDCFISDIAKLKIPIMPLTPRGRWHHRNHIAGLRAILILCQQNELFSLPEAETLKSPLLSSINGETIKQGPLQVVALHSILTEQSRWDLVFDALANKKHTRELGFRHISIGERVFVPRVPNGRSVGRLPDVFTKHNSCSPQILQPSPHGLNVGNAGLFPKDAVAIIGMACRYPDADSVEEFWDLINEGRCVIKEFPEDRFKPADLYREPKGPFWGGYLRHSDVFDHRFFGISGREAKSMDPQQRLCLEVAYEAMESAGYYGLRSDEFERDIGCYIGSANDDYMDNVASHPVSAFSLTGTLRSFISGRVSHFFGWTGPSMVIDTACSAAAVAIDAACKVSSTACRFSTRS